MATSTSAIGTARDYTTIAAWEAATDNDLVGTSFIEIGELYDDHDWNEDVTFTGATTSALYYRVLRSVAADAFDPVAGTGTEVVRSTTALSVFKTDEFWFRLGPNIGFDITMTGSGAQVAIFSGKADQIWERLFLKFRDSGSGAMTSYGMYPAGRGFLRNCIAVAETGTQDRGDYPFYLTEGTNPHDVQNCCAYNADITGIYWTGSATNRVCQNNISIGSGTADFVFAGSFGASDNDYNCSGDTSATGSNSLNSQVAADIWTTPGSDDFTLKAGSNAIDDGVDLSGTFTDDYDGTTRGATWEMGAYDYTSASTDVTVIVLTLAVPVAQVAVSTVGQFATIAATTLDVPVAVVAIAVSDNGEIHAGTWGETKVETNQRVHVRQQRSRTLRSVVGGSSTTGLECPADIWFQDLIWEGSDLAGFIWSRTQRDRGYYSGHMRFTRCEVDGLWDANNDVNPDGKTKWGFQMWDCPQHTIEYSTIHNIDLEHCVYQHLHGSNVTIWYHHSTFRRTGRTAHQFVSRLADGDGITGAGTIMVENNYYEDNCVTGGGGGSTITFAGGLVNVDATIQNCIVRMGMNSDLDPGVGENITGVIATRFERFDGSDGGFDGEPKTYSAGDGYGLKSLTLLNNDFELGEVYPGLGGPSRMMMELKEMETLTIGAGNRVWKHDGTPSPEAARIEAYSMDNGYPGLIGQVNLTHPANMTSKGRWTFIDSDGTRTYGDLSSTDAYTLMFGWETSGGLGGTSGVCFSLGDGP